MADPKRATMVERIGYFATIPLSFINDAEVSDRAHRLYVILRSYTSPDKPDWVFPGYETIRLRCGWSNYRYVASALRELETRGWISRQKRFGQSTRYNLNATPVLPTGVVMDDGASPTNGCSTVLPTGVAPVLHPLVEEQEPKNKNQKDQDTAQQKRAAADAAARAAGIDKMPSIRSQKAKEATKKRVDAKYDLTGLDREPQILTYFAHFGGVRIPREAAEHIVAGVGIFPADRDDEAWAETCKEWAIGNPVTGRTWNPLSVDRMMDLYNAKRAQRRAKARTSRASAGPALAPEQKSEIEERMNTSWA